MQSLNVSRILKVLQDRVAERKSKSSCDHHSEEAEWKKFWNEWSSKLLLHACKLSSGSLCVKVLDEMDCPLRYLSPCLLYTSDAADE